MTYTVAKKSSGITGVSFCCRLQRDPAVPEGVGGATARAAGECGGGRGEGGAGLGAQRGPATTRARPAGYQGGGQ